MENKICTKCRNEFTLDQDDFSFYERIQIPVPMICPDCRFKMRAMWRNETTLYSGQKCNLCKKNIVTMYNPKREYKVYCHSCYLGDTWDPMTFDIDFDSRPFFEQLNDLFKKVPKDCTYRSLGSGPNVNSDYANHAGGLKNSYFLFNGGPGEEMMYSRGVRDSNWVSDCYFGKGLENCYEGVNIDDSAKLIFCKNTFNSFNSIFLLNCRSVNDCFGCVNLNNKSYHFFNEPLSREGYTEKLKEILGSYQKMEEYKNKFYEFSLKFPMRENNSIKTVNSSGDYLFECKNMKDSFESNASENCKYIFSSKMIKDSIGTIGYGFHSEMLLECTSTGYSSKTIGTYSSENCQNVLYSFTLRNCHDCIGCDSLKNVSYCILNKQYAKEEYEKIKEKIVDELKEKNLHGLMMPSELSPFAYNETIAQDNMPLTKEEALAQGFRWEDDIQKTEGKETLQIKDIPDHIDDVKDSLLNEILKCMECRRNYKIVEQELLFYRKMILPIPRKCFYCRHRDRVKRRGPYKFWDRKCAKCDKDIKTNYSPERLEIVYCEDCYKQEVI